MDSSKKWYLSKTVWLNMVGGVALALSAAVPSLKGVSDAIAANAVLIGTIWAGLNLVLRMVTKDKIVLSD